MRLPYFCSHLQSNEYPNYEYPKTYALPDVNCPTGWMPYHTACYKMFAEPKSMAGANDFCKEQNVPGAKVQNLLTIWDEYEMEFAKSFLRDDALPNRDPDDLPNGFWIGLEYRYIY